MRTKSHYIPWAELASPEPSRRVGSPELCRREAQITTTNLNPLAEPVEAQLTTALLSSIKTKTPTIGNFPIVQIEKPTTSKMETVQLNQSYKDLVCSILEHSDKNALKVGGCPSTSSGTVRQNNLFSSFRAKEYTNG